MLHQYWKRCAWSIAALLVNSPPAALALDPNEVTRPGLGIVPYGVAIRHCTVPHSMALTFDDGPGVFTTKLLDLLERKGANATFFVNGLNTGDITDTLTDRPGNIKRMVESGHHVGSHGFRHLNFDDIDTEMRLEEIIKNEEVFNNLLGYFPTYFRPPYGSCDQACLDLLGDLGYHVILWDIDTRDWEGNLEASREIFIDALESEEQSTWLTLAHDVQRGTVESLAEFMIDHSRDAGYKLLTLGECLEDHNSNWYRDGKTGDRWVPPKKGPEGH